MDNTNQRKLLINEDITLLLKGLIIGKVLTILVIGGLLWWFLSPYTLVRRSVASFSGQNIDIASSSGSTFKSVANVPVGSFNYGGSPSWAPIRQLVDAYMQSDRPELQLRYVAPTKGSPSSSSGISMLLEGKLDFAQLSRPLTDKEYALAKHKGVTLKQYHVATDGIAVVVNPSLKVPGLTIDQLQKIYLGQITNWKHLGGPDIPITAFSLNSEDAKAVRFSANNDMNKQTLGSHVKYVYSTTEALRQVSKIPGSIYYASARAVVPQCNVKPLPLGRTPNQLVPPYQEPLVSSQQCPRQRNQVNIEAIKNGSYPITTKLFVVVKHNNRQQEQAGEAYAKLLLSDQGQKAIKQAGFVAVR